MKGNVLAFLENNIATRLLLASRLSALGYHVSVESSARGFRRQLEAGPFDWLVLDQAALGRAQYLLARLVRDRHRARIVWLGRPPRQSRLPIQAVFATPLVYAEIARYFSLQNPRDARCSAGSDCRDQEGFEHKSEQSPVAVCTADCPRSSR